MNEKKPEMLDDEVKQLWSTESGTDSQADIMQALTSIGSEEAPQHLKTKLLRPEALQPEKQSWWKRAYFAPVFAPALAILLIVFLQTRNGQLAVEHAFDDSDYDLILDALDLQSDFLTIRPLESDLNELEDVL